MIIFSSLYDLPRPGATFTKRLAQNIGGHAGFGTTLEIFLRLYPSYHPPRADDPFPAQRGLYHHHQTIEKRLKDSRHPYTMRQYGYFFIFICPNMRKYPYQWFVKCHMLPSIAC